MEVVKREKLFGGTSQILVEGELDKAVSEEMRKITYRKWFQEMDPVLLKIVDKGWSNKSGWYNWRKRICYVSKHLTKDGIIEMVYHELSHHIEFRHAPGFFRRKGVMHSRNFWTIFERLQSDISLSEVIKGLHPYVHCHGWTWNEDKTDLIWRR